MRIPKVSVVLPNYNHAAYLPKRIESILKQTYTDFELIILDDCSSDNSRDLIKRYVAQDNRATFYFNEHNSGSPFKQWNKGINLSKGEYIWIAESDDYADEKFLETMVPILEEYVNIGLVYCQSLKVNEVNEIVDDALPKDNPNIDYTRWLKSYQNKGQDEVTNYLIFKNTIPNASALLFRKSVYSDAEGTLTQLRLCGDWHTYIKMLKISDIYFCNVNLNYFRVHERSVRKKNRWDGIEILWERASIVQYIDENFNLPERNKTNAIKPLYLEYLLNIAKLSFQFKHWKKYKEIYNFLSPYRSNRYIKNEVNSLLKVRIKQKMKKLIRA